MSKVSNLCEFPADTRARIRRRDGGCIFCQHFGSSGFPPTQIAHYVARSHQGLGVEENGALVCAYHHQELDNGKNSEPLKWFFRSYLENQYKDWNEENMIYDKWRWTK
jgi:hypothetical protein